jgi:hypothetical protein
MQSSLLRIGWDGNLPWRGLGRLWGSLILKMAGGVCNLTLTSRMD